MKPSELIIKHSEFIKKSAAHYGFTNLRVFGHIARGHDKPQDNLYLLAEPKLKADPINQTRLERELRQHLEASVIVLTEDRLPEHMATEVSSATIPV